MIYQSDVLLLSSVSSPRIVTTAAHSRHPSLFPLRHVNVTSSPSHATLYRARRAEIDAVLVVILGLLPPAELEVGVWPAALERDPRVEDAQRDARDQHERALEDEEDGLVLRQLAVEALAQFRDSVRRPDEDAECRERQP